MIYQNEIKEGSPELTGIFEREQIGANDTSAAVGYAPLTETEGIVLNLERYLNSDAFKEAFPESGEDIKVMGYRRDRELVLTVAMAFVDRLLIARKHTSRARRRSGVPRWILSTKRDVTSSKCVWM